MAYGTVKTDNITFDQGGVDQNVTTSGIYRAITSGVTVTGTISATVLVGTTTVSGVTVTGTTVQGTTVQGVSGTFTSLTGTTTTGTTANFVSGVFTTQVSGATITGTTINGTTVNSITGNFTSLTGVTVTGTTANFVSGVFTTQLSGVTVTGTTANFTSGNFTALSGASTTVTSGIFAVGSAAAPSISFTSDPDTGIFSPGADQVAISTNGTNRLHIDSSGNVGIGTTSPSLGLLEVSSTNGVTLAIKNTSGTVVGNEFCQLTFNNTSNSATNFESAKIKAISTNGGANLAHLTFENSGSERVRIDSSGRLLVGTSTSIGSTSGNYPIQAVATGAGGGAIASLGLSFTPDSAGYILGGVEFNSLATSWKAGASVAGWSDGVHSSTSRPSRLVFSTTADGASSPTERMRITQAGDVLVAKTTVNDLSVIGIQLGAGTFKGTGIFTTGDESGIFINRQNSDGSLVNFYQANAYEGGISVSGTTVSYNGAHLSRWSQLPGGAIREEILRGTVLSNIDEMCAWGEETNEQLNRMKVSDVEGDPNVAGVFQAWDDDDDTYTDDFYCAMTGDFIIRIAEGVTVQRGDLLMSAGDGTAKPQDDDIIRSKTVAKVTSTHVTCTYDDGSYCVPCVLMAC